VPHRHAKEGRGFVTIPEGALVTVAGDADDRRFVPVRWGDQELFVFEQDLNASCRTRIIESSDIDRR
jgi:hypothetical protein